MSAEDDLPLPPAEEAAYLKELLEEMTSEHTDVYINDSSAAESDALMFPIPIQAMLKEALRAVVTARIAGLEAGLAAL
jgi:hypothetical protein